MDAVNKEISSDGFTLEYASFWIRVWAIILDGFLAGIVTFFGAILMIAAIGFFRGISTLNEDLVNNIKQILTWIYFIFMTYKYQATFGKQMAGIKVVSKDGKKALLWQIIVRETIGKIISVITVIGIFMPLFTKRKQALHDKIVGTYVIYS